MEKGNSRAYPGYSYVHLSKDDTVVDVIIAFGEGNNATFFDDKQNQEMIVVRLFGDRCEEALPVDALRGVLLPIPRGSG